MGREVNGGRKNLEEPETSDEIRCECGSLLARLIPEGVELKCRRCKRVSIVPLSPPHDPNEEAP